MKRRRLILPTLSLLLCLLASAAWARTATGWSHWAAVQGPYSSYIATLSGGYLTIQIASLAPDPEAPAAAHWQTLNGPVLPFSPVGVITDASPWSRLGLIRTVEHIPYGNGIDDQDPNIVQGTAGLEASCRSFILPLWAVAALAALAPARSTVLLLRERTRRSLIRQGRCPACRYDLRATVSGRCPECGQPVPSPGTS
jgi:hypothetical protein